MQFIFLRWPVFDTCSPRLTNQAIAPYHEHCNHPRAAQACHRRLKNFFMLNRPCNHDLHTITSILPNKSPAFSVSPMEAR
jgi:hypothetical protein